MRSEASKNLSRALSGSGSARCDGAGWAFWEDHLGGNHFLTGGRGGLRRGKGGEEEGRGESWRWGERERGKDRGERQRQRRGGTLRPAALLTAHLPCRPHAVDAGAREAVAGVGDKGVRLDGDRHIFLPEHGRQGTV